MKRSAAALILAVVASAAAATSASAHRRRATHENPHAAVTAVARVETDPRRTRHANGRLFEELEVLLLSVNPDEDRGFPVETHRPVRIVHDLTCGGAWVAARRGDRLDVRGEYVHTPQGRDLIHFTHPADRSCGTGRRAGGYLRLHHEAAADSGADSTGLSERDAALFRTSLRPILSARCAPCHEPGGRMYGRLPFDDPATVASHAARMAPRLKGDDRRTLEAWAAQVDPRPR
ncbi:MAG: hypothetical protein ABI592_13285 [Acidobacteriota bacterium]